MWVGPCVISCVAIILPTPPSGKQKTDMLCVVLECKCVILEYIKCVLVINCMRWSDSRICVVLECMCVILEYINTCVLIVNCMHGLI